MCTHFFLPGDPAVFTYVFTPTFTFTDGAARDCAPRCASCIHTCRFHTCLHTLTFTRGAACNHAVLRVPPSQISHLPSNLPSGVVLVVSCVVWCCSCCVFVCVTCAAPAPSASLGRRTVCGRTEQRRPPDLKRYETKVRMVWGSFLFAAAALKTPTINGCNVQGVHLTFHTCLHR